MSTLEGKTQKPNVIHSHEWFMTQALKQAAKAYAMDETPVGAVVVHQGKIISRGYNTKEHHQDPTLHAEMIAIKKACKKLGTWRLNECDLYTTLEPCTMCAGAILHARIQHLYIGAYDPKAGAVGSVINVLQVEAFNHKVEVTYGVLETQCSQVLKTFFRDLRQRKSVKG